MAIRAKEIKSFLKATQLAIFYCSLPYFQNILFLKFVSLAFYVNN